MQGARLELFQIGIAMILTVTVLPLTSAMSVETESKMDKKDVMMEMWYQETAAIKIVR